MLRVLVVAYKDDGSDDIAFEEAVMKVNLKQLRTSKAEAGDCFRAIVATYPVKYKRRPLALVDSQGTSAALAQLD
jgi:hypothetical protein